jgi:UDP:flavonoid glycosyltransferase YjiC (YdhE family)
MDLATDNPTPEQVRDAVDHILAQPAYRARAGELAQEFARYDTPREVTTLLEALAAEPAWDPRATSSPQVKATEPA